MSKGNGNGDIPAAKGRLRDIWGKFDKTRTVKERLDMAKKEQERHEKIRAARERSREARVKAQKERKEGGKK